MKKDIEIVSSNIKFKYRVSGLLVVDNKLLVCKINNNNFYCLPGGHVELFENSRDAIIREFKEERLLYLTENFFKSGKYECHEIGMYYLLSANNIKVEDFERKEEEIDGITTLSFKWQNIDNLENIKPEFLKEKLDLDKTKHLVIKSDKIILEE